MAKVNSFNFGFIVIDGKQYTYDVLILPDGLVTERKVDKARVGSHTVTWEDLQNLVKAKPETIIIGTGASGLARLSREAELNLEQSEVKVTALPTFQAVKKFNEMVDEGKRVAALMHVTC